MTMQVAFYTGLSRDSQTYRDIRSKTGGRFVHSGLVFTDGQYADSAPPPGVTFRSRPFANSADWEFVTVTNSEVIARAIAESLVGSPYDYSWEARLIDPTIPNGPGYWCAEYVATCLQRKDAGKLDSNALYQKLTGVWPANP
jgi:uncharacterized protein YycO